jgi:hypothetical protein
MRPIMSLDERIHVLRTVATFAEHSPHELADLADALGELSVAPGTVLAREERPGNGERYVIVSGEAALTRAGVRHGTVGPGALVPAAPTNGTAAPATVTAVTLMHLLVLRDGATTNTI